MKFQARTELQDERFYTNMYDSRVQVAVPKAFGGDNVGTSPLKIMCSAVASCVALMVFNQLDEDDSLGMMVEVTAEKAKVKLGQTTFLTNWVITIELPNIIIHVDDAVEDVLRGLGECPAEQLLVNAGEEPKVLLNGYIIKG